MMTLIEEKHTPNAISFVVEMPAGPSMQEKVPEVKKRLEEQSVAQSPLISLEQIQAKLEKATEKRRLSLHRPQSFEEKLNKITERKSSLEKIALEHNTKFETTLHRAEENREQVLARKVNKI
jgi:hypothetical protein